MGFTNIKAKNQGFTIVELLIVVVVIAILAAITIVSYNGITNRANASAAKSTAATWQKKIELYQAEESAYPYQGSQLGTSTKTYYIPVGAGTSVINTNPDASNGKSKVRVQACAGTSATAAPASSADVSGIRISYWEYDKSPSAGISTINIGGAMHATHCTDLGTTAS